MTALKIFGARTFPTNGNLRELARWWPEVPSTHLCLNEGTFLKETTYMQSIEPLVWVRFGGHGGRNLSHPSEIRGCGQRKLFRLDFVYELEAGLKSVVLGRTKAIPGTKRAQADIVTKKFFIDGPGGEFISKVDLLYDFEESRRKKKRKRGDEEEVEPTAAEIEAATVRTAIKAERKNDFDHLTVSLGPQPSDSGPL